MSNITVPFILEFDCSTAGGLMNVSKWSMDVFLEDLYSLVSFPSDLSFLTLSLLVIMYSVFAFFNSVSRFLLLLTSLALLLMNSEMDSTGVLARKLFSLSLILLSLAFIIKTSWFNFFWLLFRLWFSSIKLSIFSFCLRMTLQNSLMNFFSGVECFVCGTELNCFWCLGGCGPIWLVSSKLWLIWIWLYGRVSSVRVQVGDNIFSMDCVPFLIPESPDFFTQISNIFFFDIEYFWAEVLIVIILLWGISVFKYRGRHLKIRYFFVSIIDNRSWAVSFKFFWW